MPAWEKWKNFDPGYENRKEAWKNFVLKHPECSAGPSYTTGTTSGGTLRKNTPRREKFGHSHSIGGVKVK